ncbi:MAG TPA: hypothetical protein VIK95_12865 [Egibacteraceae bacterium]
MVRRGTLRTLVAAVAAAVGLLAAGCSGDRTDSAAPSPTPAGDDAVEQPADGSATEGGDDMTEHRSQQSVDRRRSSGSEHIRTDDAIATPRADPPAAGTQGEAVVEDAVADLCAGAGLAFAREHGSDVRTVAGYAAPLGAFASWRVQDGTTTLSVSVVDSTRSEDEPVALCYYDGDFHEVPGRDVTRIGVLVHEDGTTRLVLRGDAERLGLHRPPTT